MTPAVRRFVGLAGVLLLAAFWGDFRRHQAAEEPAVPPRTSAFVQEVEGFGRVQTSIAGHVEFLAGRMSNRSGAPEIRVEGEDPVFGDGEVVLQRAFVRQIDLVEGKLLYEAHSKVARIALQPGSGGLIPDRLRPWILENAEVIWSPEGANFRMETDHLKIHTEEPPWMETDDPVWIEGGGIRIAGWGIRLYPAEERFELGPGNTVEWEWRAQEALWSGRGDGPVRLGMKEGITAALEIPTTSACRMNLPLASGWPGNLESQGLRVQFELQSGDWQPKRATLGAPCRWTGALAAPEGLETLAGKSCSVRWSTTGILDQVEWSGPVAVTGSIPDTDGALTAATATVGNVVMRGTGGALLQQGVQGKTANGNFSAQSGIMESDGQFRLQGEVSLEDGRAQSDLFLRQPDGSLRLEGRAILRPEEGFEIAAETVSRHRDGWLRATGSPRVTRQTPGLPYWFLTAGTMDWHPSWRGNEQASIHAWDAVRVEREGAVFRGEDLRWIPDIRTELVGRPAVADFPMGEGVLHLSSRRFLWEKGIFVADGKPSLDFPADSLELEGDRIQVEAERMHWRQETGKWEILGSVSFAGALTGTARRVSGNASAAELQPPSGGICRLQGRLADGQEFAVEATHMRVRGNRLSLDRNASARFPLAEGGDFIVSGREGEISPRRGWFAHGVEVHGEELEGRADYSSWSRIGSALDTLRLDGAAHLKHAGTAVFGEEILFQPRIHQVTVAGAPNEPARAVLEDGRTTDGDLIHVDLKFHLLSGVRGSIRRP